MTNVRTQIKTTKQVTSDGETSAVVFESPGNLSLRSLPMITPSANDLVVDVLATGISTGTERLLWDGEMPEFPGMGYPLVPGYEAVGTIRQVGAEAQRQAGEFVFIGGANTFSSVRNLFGSAASTLIVPAEKAIPINRNVGNDGLLLALAATAYHALHVADSDTPNVPDLIVGHGILGRLMLRLCCALHYDLPTVWEINKTRMQCDKQIAKTYKLLHPELDERQDYCRIIDVSGDSEILYSTVGRLKKRIAAKAPPEVILAGFYRKPLSFDFVQAFMREIRIQIAAEWTPADMHAVTELIQSERLRLDGLITHTVPAIKASDAYMQAFRDDSCLKMALDWSEVQ